MLKRKIYSNFHQNRVGKRRTWWKMISKIKTFNAKFTLKIQRSKVWRKIAKLLRLERCKRMHILLISKNAEKWVFIFKDRRRYSRERARSTNKNINDIRIPYSQPSKIMSSSTVINGALYDYEPIYDLFISSRREPLCVSHRFVQAWTDASFLTARHPSSAWSIESRWRLIKFSQRPRYDSLVLITTLAVRKRFDHICVSAI